MRYATAWMAWLFVTPSLADEGPIVGIERIAPTVVQVTAQGRDLSAAEEVRVGRPIFGSVLGSGFIVSRDGYVVTAHHVVEAGKRRLGRIEAERRYLTIGVPMELEHPGIEFRGSFIHYQVSIVDQKPEHDLALLKVSVPEFAERLRRSVTVHGKNQGPEFDPPEIAAGERRDGDQIAVTGYPFAMPIRVTNAGWIASSLAYSGAPNGVDYLLGDVQINKGNSGGPAYLAGTGTIIGVVSASRLAAVVDRATERRASLFYNSGLAVIVPSKYVVEMLDEHGVNWGGSEE